MTTQNHCADCGVAPVHTHITGRCSACDRQRIVSGYEERRQKVARYEVTPPGSPWIEGVDLDAICPQACYRTAQEYACHASRVGEKHHLVHGETSLAFGGHAWVELPLGLVFDGVYQRYYRTADYCGAVANATPWYIYTADAALMLSAHLRSSLDSWWLKLELPMIIERPPIRIDTDSAWELLVSYYGKCDEAVLRDLPTNVLRGVAEGHGVDGTRRMKKPDLIGAIRQR